MPRAAADGVFGAKQRKSNQHDRGKVGKNESAPAVLAGDIGKAPDIAEADGGADRRHQKAEARGPGFAFAVDAASNRHVALKDWPGFARLLRTDRVSVQAEKGKLFALFSERPGDLCGSLQMARRQISKTRLLAKC